MERHRYHARQGKTSRPAGDEPFDAGVSGGNGVQGANMKICVIGGTGHISRYLVPFLVEDGHEVVAISRGSRPAPSAEAWSHVRFVRAEYAPGDRAWGQLVSGVAAEVVIDLLGKDLPATYAAARATCRHLVACGSLWMLGPPSVVPTPEVTQAPARSEIYTKRYEEILAIKGKAKRDGVPFTAIFPPNICGPGKVPLEAHGGRSVEVHRAHMAGRPVKIPAGCITLIGPCDVSDVAQGFRLAVANRDAAANHIFNVGSASALSVRRFVRVYADIYGTDIPIEEVPLPEFLTKVLPDREAHDHFLQHMCPDISKARERLGYRPVYNPETAMERAVAWMKEEGLLT
jgi:nucleoside-diphosphate-sugar epimerase